MSFPDMVKKVVAALKEKQKAGAYARFQTPAEVANRLTKDLQKITGDLHLHVGVDPDWVAAQGESVDAETKKALAEAELQRVRETNYGFEAVRLLEGNIGYINCTYFADPEYAHAAAATAMRFVENTEALIFDLRYNNGGYMEMVQLLASYMFTTEEPQMLFDYYYVEDGKRIEQAQWVLPFVPGVRYPEKPLYILTSATSFSAAEWFAFVLKNLGRATVVGEQTAGGAHPVARKAVDKQFFVQLPIGEIKDPVYRQDFEGRGVLPDVPVAAVVAREVAHRAALADLAVADSSRSRIYDWYLPIVENRMRPAILEADVQRAIAGKYEGREITIDNNILYYSWGARIRVALKPLSQSVLALDGDNNFRFYIVRSQNSVTGLRRTYRDGSTQFYRRLE